MVELLRTKLFIPHPRSNLVRRPRLIERLNAGLNKKLTLIAAPAGFGKTTLLSEWIPQSPRCVTWLSLDTGDNDLTKFWAYFISSLQQLQSDLGAGALELLQSTQAPKNISILTALINDITAFPDLFAIVLDDYHVIEHQEIHDALIFLIDHLPDNMHLVITARANPLLPLARLQARDKLTELRAHDLRFTTGEAAEFLTRSMELNLTVDEVAVLEARTEGWIAGLQIAALSMQGRDEVQGFIRTFSGSHRHILGYLAAEVLDQRPRGTLDFLLKTSILDRLCGALCDAVTGDSDGRETLETLERANLFITPLDDEGVWYRYNHLFAEVLQLRLKRTWPDLVNELHLRAGNWFVRQGMLEEAVHHTLLGADFEEASNLIEGVAGDLLRRGAIASLTSWLDAIPEETIYSRPRLCLARGWAAFMGTSLDLVRAEQWVQLALQTAEVEGKFEPDLNGEAAALQGMIAATRSEVARSLELSSQALEYLPLDSPWRSAVAFCLGTAHYISGELSAAVPVFEEALRLSQANAELFIQSASASFLAEILVFQGHLNSAMELFEQVLARADPALPQKGDIMAHAGRAGILYEWGQFEAALAQIRMGIDQVDQVGGAWATHVLYRILARLQKAQGNWADALKSLDRSQSLGQTAQVGLVTAQAAALRACLQLGQGDLEAALAWAENSGLSPDDPQASHPGWHEVEYLALARVLTAQARHTESLSLLDQLLSAAEIEARHGSAIAILIVQALACQVQDSGRHALECLERALTLAEPEGYIRIFVDEGDPMRRMLADFRSNPLQKKDDMSDKTLFRQMVYVDKLLAAFSQSPLATANEPEMLLEPLSERELEVLQLISIGLSNQEIADQLIIAVSTVKSHINSLYSKLGTHRRTQAIVMARDLDLISD